jgi:hypothetical protein
MEDVYVQPVLPVLGVAVGVQQQQQQQRSVFQLVLSCRRDMACTQS